jgi:hypothetical protein
LVSATRGFSVPIGTLAGCVGFSREANLSRALHAPTVTVTPLLRERMAALAALVGYLGPLFEAIDEREGDAQ